MPFGATCLAITFMYQTQTCAVAEFAHKSTHRKNLLAHVINSVKLNTSIVLFLLAGLVDCFFKKYFKAIDRSLCLQVRLSLHAIQRRCRSL